MAQKQFSKKQGIAIVATVVTAFGLLLWGGSTLARSQGTSPVAPREVVPVSEEVVAGGREEETRGPAPSSDAAARREEVLQNLKYSATQGK